MKIESLIRGLRQRSPQLMGGQYVIAIDDIPIGKNTKCSIGVVETATRSRDTQYRIVATFSLLPDNTNSTIEPWMHATVYDWNLIQTTLKAIEAGKPEEDAA